MEKLPGLTHNEARSLLRQYGFNELHATARSSPVTILLRQIKKNVIVYLLLSGAIISLLVGESLTGYAILLVLIMIVAIGFFQEHKAEQAVQALQDMITPVSLVIRDGRQQEIPSRRLVPGDIVLLRIGEKVPADCAVLDEDELFVNESILSGEAKEIKKNAEKDSSDYKDENMIFMGSYIANGRCRAIVTHTGMNTRFGNIANMISQTEKSLPLQDKINKITRYMVGAAIAISLLTGTVLFVRAATFNPEVLFGILILMIALCVAAFPEGLPVVLVTTLAVGAVRMARQNAIVSRLSIIETLGETTVICADKTGTITSGQMTVKKIIADDEIIDVEGTGHEAKGEFRQNGKIIDAKKNVALGLILKCAVLCNDAKISQSGEKEDYDVIGTPTEGSLLVAAAKSQLFQEDIKAERLEEIPFNSGRKMMSVLCKIGTKKYVFSKGGVEILLKKCSRLQKGKKAVRLDAKEIKKIESIHHGFTSGAYRAIGFAYKEMCSADDKNIEQDLIFLGMAGIDDPPREQIAESIQACKDAGISVKMITGDNTDTARAIGKSIGLEGKVLEGSELDKLFDRELSEIISDVVIFARVSPEHKLRIVQVLKQNGEIVTMTGDGVNDAPALKEAHIGVAMGKNGTDVSRSVADLILKDDNFATIVMAIKEGRTVFNNIRKFVAYQLSCNWGELLIIFSGVLLAPFLGWKTPLLLALQILFMNLVIDDLPAITLGLNIYSKDVMREKPRIKAPIINREAMGFMVLFTFLTAILTLASFYISFNVLHNDLKTARTSALVSIILLQIAGAFSFRSFRHPVLTGSLVANPYLFAAAGISLTATLFVIYSPLNILFETAPLPALEWGIAIYSSLILIVIFDQVKFFTQRKHGLGQS